MGGRMRSSYPVTAGLVLLGAMLLGQPILARADGQSPSAVQDDATAPEPSENLPADFIDSRPIVAYFGDQPMPDTVRGLLEELKRPGRCGKDAELRPQEACAIVFYRLDNNFEPGPLRPPLIMRAVYRITEPEDPANTVMTMPDGKGDLKRYTDGDLYEPLRDIRANICRHDKRKPNECLATDSKGVLYRPYGILGKVENDREGILPAKSANKHFALNLKPANADQIKEDQMRDLCWQQQGGKPLMVC